MALNAYFDQGGGLDSTGYSTEQTLIESLYTEAIKIYGFDVHYIPRTLVNEDTIFTEDGLSKFTSAHPIEMYLQSVDGFEGEGDFLSKFGVEIRDRASFVVVKSRWTTEVDNNASLIVEGRPNEGDLLWFPLTNSLFEIKFVEHENIFYQLNQIYTYRLDVEQFIYSNEALDTGVAAIDAIETTYSSNAFEYELRLEDASGSILLEDGFKLIKEDYNLATIVPSSQNYDFGLSADDIIDFSVSNPFGEVQR
jgi:hypothetical protein